LHWKCFGKTCHAGTGGFIFGQRHSFDAEYGESSALIDILHLSIFSGALPPWVTGLVIEWVTTHRQGVLNDWARARKQQDLHKIAPLE
jgi:hypothetical protein